MVGETNQTVPMGQSILPFSYLWAEAIPDADGSYVRIPVSTLRTFVRHMLRFVEFDLDYACRTAGGLVQAFGDGHREKIARHYSEYGYFEGREPHPYYFPEIERFPLTEPISDAYFDTLRLAQDVHYAGDSEYCLQLLDEAADIHPAGFNAAFLKGDMLRHQYDVLGSVQFLIKALTVRTDDKRARRSLKSALDRIGDAIVTYSKIESLAALIDSTPVWLAEWRFENAVRTQRWGEAWRHYIFIRKQLTDHAPHGVESRYLEIICGKREEVLNLIKHRRAGQLPTGDLLLLLSLIARFGRPKIALRMLQTIDHLSFTKPHDITLVVNVIEASLGFNAARQYLEALGTKSPQLLPSLIAMELEVLFRAGAYQDLLKAWHLHEPRIVDSNTQSHVAFALMATGAIDKLTQFCVEWQKTTRGDLRPCKYAIFAAFLNGLIRAPHVTQRIVGMELLTRATSVTQPPPAPGPRIPQHMVQFWDKVDPPAEVAELCGLWAAEFGEKNYRLFNDQTAIAFIKADFDDEVVELYESCYHPAMKADFFRLLYLYKRGGFYADADDAPMPGVSWLRRQTMTAELILIATEPQVNITNLFIAAIPGHVVVENALNDVLAGLRRAKQEGVVPGIQGTTGPGALTRGLQTVLLSASEDREEILRNICIYDGQTHHDCVGQSRRLNYKSQPMGHWGDAERAFRGKAVPR